jgi:hypothetical protein
LKTTSQIEKSSITTRALVAKTFALRERMLWLEQTFEVRPRTPHFGSTAAGCFWDFTVIPKRHAQRPLSRQT